jgi:GrpB-like predicted nucleotidyltransferase (UPF0157 family)
MCVDEPVHLQKHDPEWIHHAAREIQRLAVGEGVAGPIEHIGSTAVADLVSKPIMDLMLGVATYPASSELRDSLRALGYEDLGEAGVPGRHYFRRRSAHSFNLHVVLHGGEHWRNNLAVRELLRSSCAERERYGEAKRSAIDGGAGMLVDYSRRKSGAMAELILRAHRHHR